MKITKLTLNNDEGLHARPGALFVQTANRFKSQIKVRNLTKNTKASDGKSILGLLVLGVEKNHVIELEIDGEDEETATTCLKLLIESDFQHEETSGNQDGHCA